jgi:hypothetical protein
MVVLLPLLVVALEPINEKVVAYARSQLGQKVGDGECTALVREALRSAGAKARGHGRSWGTELSSLKDVQPGDILQFEDAVFVQQRLLPSGDVSLSWARYPHHSAIVSAVRRRGKGVVLAILQQNAGTAGGDEAVAKVVRQATIDLDHLRRGRVRAYRPDAE